jgi:cell division protein FtsB
MGRYGEGVMIEVEYRKWQAKLTAQAEQYQELIAQLHRDIAELRRENKRLKEKIASLEQELKDNMNSV